LRIAVGRLAAVVALCLTGAGAARAQGAPAGAGAPGFKNPKGDTDVRTNREAALRSAEVRGVGGRMDQRQLAAAIDRTKQDFKRIQLVRNDVIDALVADKPPDYKLISEQAAEINRRANRLKSFLMPSAPEGPEKGAPARAVYDAAQIKGALVKLCNTIHSFTVNPMFKDPAAALDTRKAEAAGGDLLNIIELSDALRKSAELLAKSSK
jgi:hypothetical protein